MPNPASIRLVAIIAVTALVCGCSPPTGKGQRFLIPSGYAGEVFVEYAVAGAPPLPLEDGARVMVIPADGWLKTSSDIQTGWRHNDELYFWDGKSRTPASSVVPAYQRLGASNGTWSCPKTGGGALKGEIFFLGTEEQWRATSYNNWTDAPCMMVAARLRGDKR